MHESRPEPRQRAAATRRRKTDEARPLRYLSVAVVASLIAHSSSLRKEHGIVHNVVEQAQQQSV